MSQPMLTFVAAMALSTSGCAAIKPVVKSVNDVAQELCSVFYAKRQGITLDDAAKAFCATEKQLGPWIDEVLSAEHRAAVKQGMEKP